MKTSIARALALSLFALGSTVAQAQDWPGRAVRFVVPFPAGGSGDIAARLVGQKVSEMWNQPVVVENRVGGNTIIAAEFVAKSAPDGLTLLVPVDATFTMNGSLYAKLPYRPQQDFAPVTLLVEQPLIFSAGPKAPNIRTFKDFIDTARANPGKMNVAVGAIVTQVIAELVKTSANVDFLIVPYKGSQPTLAAILGGDTEVSLSDVGPFAANIRDGKLRGLAATSGKRAPALPDMPTLAEAGLPGIAISSWFGLAAPAGTPAPVVNKISADVRRALGMADVREKLGGVGLEGSPSTPQEFAARIKAEAERWDVVIKRAGIKLD
jgi:tripartite-type tricarboxylate transporter receptor subunit TctC